MSTRRPTPSPPPLFWQQVNLAAWRQGHDAHCVAAGLHLSLRQLQRRWQEEGVGTLEDWLQQRRLLDALRLLHIFGSVKEAACLAGYPTTAQFCRAFKRRLGISPGRHFAQYRRRQPEWCDPKTGGGFPQLQQETREFCRLRLERARRAREQRRAAARKK